MVTWPWTNNGTETHIRCFRGQWCEVCCWSARRTSRCWPETPSRRSRPSCQRAAETEGSAEVQTAAQSRSTADIFHTTTTTTAATTARHSFHTTVASLEISYYLVVAYVNELFCKNGNHRNQANSECKHSLTFRVRRYVVVYRTVLLRSRFCPAPVSSLLIPSRSRRLRFTWIHFWHQQNRHCSIYSIRASNKVAARVSLGKLCD